jgi:hypothetical protein
MKRLFSNVLLIPSWICFVFAAIISFLNFNFSTSVYTSNILLPNVETVVNKAKCEGLNTDIIIKFVKSSVEQGNNVRDLIWAVVFLLLVIGAINIFLVIRNGRLHAD